jgi:predicted dienelactone hydrolase
VRTAITLRSAVRACIASLAAWVVGCGGPRVSERSVEIAGLQVTVWSAEAAVAGREPVLIFSHGFHGCSTHSRFLMRAFAAAGYLVFAPNHADSICKGGTAQPPQSSDPPLNRPDEWTDASHRDRADDIRRLVGAIGVDPRFAARVDLTRLGLVGHSLGGYAMLALGGACVGQRLDGVQAVLALSPYLTPFIRRRTLSQLTVPVMYQGGTLDLGITPNVRKPDGAYEQSPPPKYYVEFERADHLAWTDGNRWRRGAIVAYSLAFLDHYVKHETAGPVLTHPDAQVAILRFSSELGRNEPGSAGGRP